MRRRFRLTGSEDIRRVRRFGKSYAHPLVVLLAQTNDKAQVHVGVVAGRGVGTAVKRNRAKRLMRAGMQSLLPSVAAGWDVVLIARRAMVASDVYEVREALLALLRRAALISPA